MKVNCGVSRAANLGGRGPCLASWPALQVVGYKEDNVDHFHQTSPQGFLSVRKNSLLWVNRVLSYCIFEACQLVQTISFLCNIANLLM